jgi:hypothetical protein
MIVWSAEKWAARRPLKRNGAGSKCVKAGIKGITWCRINCKWRARMWTGNIHRSLGYFISKGDAVAALQDAVENRREMFEVLDSGERIGFREQAEATHTYV